MACFHRMQNEGLLPNSRAFISVLKACTNMQCVRKGKEIHVLILIEESLLKNVFIGTALVDMYAKCRMVSMARRVFDGLPKRNVVSWNALISGYVNRGCERQALICFEEMQHEGQSPDATTFACTLKACGIIGNVKEGQNIHNQILQHHFLQSSTLVANALLDMYVKCGELEKATVIFDNLPLRDRVTWNIMIAGHAMCGFIDKAIWCFESMCCDGFSPDEASLLPILKGCAKKAVLWEGAEKHGAFIRDNLLRRNAAIGTALVNMYAKCGDLKKAQMLFNEFHIRDVISWNALIGGYALHGFSSEAIKSFKQMRQEGFSPNEATFVSVLQACSTIGSVEKGKEIENEIVKEGLLGKNVMVGSALVDMYCKCGAFKKAQEILDKLEVRDVVSWTALIAGYAHLGSDDIVCELFNKMVGEGVQPNLITFTAVFNACRHSGVLDKGQSYFEVMSRHYGVMPTLEHHKCMVDLFGRAGHFQKAVAVMEKMPPSCDFHMLTTLLGACLKWGNKSLGRWAYDNAMQLEERDPAVYVCMSNLNVVNEIQENMQSLE